VTSCTLPNKGDSITSDDFTFYTVTAADYNQNPQHILSDDISIAWSEPVCVNGGCPVGGQTGTTGASTTVLNFTPSVNTQLVPAGPVAIGASVHDTATLTNASADAGGTVSYAVYSDNACTQLVQALGTKTVTNGVVPNSDTWTPASAGNFWFQATYSGDAANQGPVSSACTSEPITVSPNTPSINTQLVPAGPVSIGTPIHDTSSLTGATANAGGTVSYAVYSDNTCSTLVQALGTKTVTNGVVPDSDTFTPQAAGNFWFQATYSGDANNTGPVSSACLSEPIAVNPNTPSINTQLVPAGPVAIGAVVHDTATLVGATANAGGTVSYAVYSNNTCTTVVQALGTKTVTNGVVPNSDNWTPNAAGNFWFQATYSGDANNTGPVSSACTSEPITVLPNTPTINTQLVPAGPVNVGTSVHDTATLVGATANAGGTVSYAVYSNNTCTTLVQTLGTKTVTNGVVPNSDNWTAGPAGNFWFQATYSGDANNTGPVSSSCTSEPITVAPNTPTVATQLVPAGPVAIGTPVHDTAQISGATANAMGTVSFAVYSNNTCTTLVQSLGTVAVVNGVPVGPSNDFTPSSAGDFYFQATYSGDINNTGPVSSVCTTEHLVVVAPGITIVKKTNGADANDPNGADVPNIKPGDPVTWTYIVTNTGGTSVPKADVKVTDNTTGVTPTFSSEQSGNGDQIFDPGEVWIYTATGTALDLTQPPPAGTNTQPNACTHNNTEPGRTAYVNQGKAEIPGTSASDPSSYCNPPPPPPAVGSCWETINPAGQPNKHTSNGHPDDPFGGSAVPGGKSTSPGTNGNGPSNSDGFYLVSGNLFSDTTVIDFPGAGTAWPANTTIKYTQRPGNPNITITPMAGPNSVIQYQIQAPGDLYAGAPKGDPRAVFCGVPPPPF
jgi:hypothetical protein